MFCLNLASAILQFGTVTLLEPLCISMLLRELFFVGRNIF